jgi:hypothetical protein
MDEEGQIFGRIQQLWGPERLEQAGAQMQMQRDRAATRRNRATSRIKPAKVPVTSTTAPARRARRGR